MSQDSRRKEIIKIGAEINEVETKKTTEKKSTKQGVGFLFLLLKKINKID